MSIVPERFLEVVGCLDVLQVSCADLGQLEVALEVGLAGDGGLEVLDGGGLVVDGEADLAEDVEDLVVVGVDLDGVLGHLEAALVLPHQVAGSRGSY